VEKPDFGTAGVESGTVPIVAEASAPRGRPRSEKSRQAILAAADELLLRHGLDGVSMDEVAEAAGASKATIYRWWPSKHLLALDALLIAFEDITGKIEDTGTLRGDLVSVLTAFVKRVTSRPYARVLSGLIAEVHRDPAFGRVWRERFLQERRARGRHVFARAVERGEIPADTDVELMLDLLFGAIYHRLLHGHEPLNASVAERVVDAVLTGAVESSRSA
jgi:AcrR family transcriptional regulator